MRGGTRGRAQVAVAAALLAACTPLVPWQQDVIAALAAARRSGREVVVFFALPGRDASDRMQATLDDEVVRRALTAGAFDAVVVDGTERAALYQAMVGGGEGMGIAVLDATGAAYAARPGPQDPDELAAFVTACASQRARRDELRRRFTADPRAPLVQHELGCLHLELGGRVAAEPLLLDAAMAGVADARHRLARLYALDGNLAAARRWLAAAPRTPAARVTEGYVLFKERQHAAAVRVLDEVALDPGIGDDRQRALLYLGKALHEDKQDARATAVLQALAREGSGSVFEAAARHTLTHLASPGHGHAH
jgi:hypothetical protein